MQPKQLGYGAQEKTYCEFPDAVGAGSVLETGLVL
jgi:hypothetical protein